MCECVRSVVSLSLCGGNWVASCILYCVCVCVVLCGIVCVCVVGCWVSLSLSLIFSVNLVCMCVSEMGCV